VWVLAAASLAVAVLVFAAESFVLPRALAGDPARAVAVLDTLALVGRDASHARAQVGTSLAQRKQNAEALAQYRRSAELRPAASTFANVALMHARLGDMDESRRAQDTAVALAPDDAALLGFVAELSERQGDAVRARELRDRLAAIARGEGGAPAPRERPALY
jgi:tetratricopeptide (TPR) repeat protein